MCDGETILETSGYVLSVLPRCSNLYVYSLLLLTKWTQGEEQVLTF